MEPSEQSGPDSASQDVNPMFLQQLRELDIPEEAAKQVGSFFRGPHLEEHPMRNMNWKERKIKIQPIYV